MKKIRVSFETDRFNQFSFSEYDSDAKNWSPLEGGQFGRKYPVAKEKETGKFMLVLGEEWFQDIPLYKEQLQLIVNCWNEYFEKESVNLPITDLIVSYNNYGHINYVIKYDNIEDSQTILEWWESDDHFMYLEDLAMDFRNISDDYEITDILDVEAFLDTEKRLGYSRSSLENILDKCDDSIMEEVKIKYDYLDDPYVKDME